MESLSASETVSDETVREVRAPEYVQAKPSEEPALFTALKIRTPTAVREVEQVLDHVELAEFGPSEWPLRELATISVLTRHGISTEQVTAIILFISTHCGYVLVHELEKKKKSSTKLIVRIPIHTILLLKVKGYNRLGGKAVDNNILLLYF